MQCKDKGGGGGGLLKELLDFIQNTNKRRCYKHYGEKMSGPESSPTELSTEIAFPLYRKSLQEVLVGLHLSRMLPYSAAEVLQKGH